MQRIVRLLPLILILIVIFFSYRQVLNFDYLWDDDLLIVDNVDLINSQLNWDILARPVLPGSSYFRPLVFFSWFMEFKLFGQSSYISHFINLFIFLLNISLVYWLAYLIGKVKGQLNLVLFATICTILYAIHPIHVETTAWVSGRFDLMATFFSLLACILFLYQKTKEKYSLILNLNIGFCYFLALMSKELGLIVPVLIFILYMALSLDNFKLSFINFFKKNYSLVGIILIFFILYYVLRVSSMRETYHYPFTWNYYYENLFQQQLPLYAIKQYFLHAFLPFYTLGPIQPTEIFIQKSIINILSIMVVAFFVIYLIMGAIKKSFFSWMMLAYLTTISLVIFIIPISSGNNIIQERFMTLGLSFFMIGIVYLIFELKNKSIKILCTILLCLWSIGAYATTKSIIPFWKNEVTLWSWVYKNYPDLSTIRNLYYFSLLKYNLLNELIEIVNDTTISKGKSLHIADQILYGKALLVKQDPESIEYLKGVIEVLPKFHEEYPNASANLFQKLGVPYELTSMQIATAYDSLAIATLWFENNPKKALEYNYIAERYLDSSEKYPVLYNRIAFLKVLGRNKEAEILFNEVTSVAMYRKNDNLQNINKIIKNWCSYNQVKVNCPNQ